MCANSSRLHWQHPLVSTSILITFVSETVASGAVEGGPPLRIRDDSSYTRFRHPLRNMVQITPRPAILDRAQKIASSKRARAATVKRRSFSVRAFPLLGKFRGDDGRGERTSESCSGSSDHRVRTFALSQNEYPILRVIGQLEA